MIILTLHSTRFLSTVVRYALVTIISLFVPAIGSTEAFYAAQIGKENIHRLPAGGLDAIGGMGDWFLTDGELCAVVSAREHPTYLSLHGGALVDLWHCAKANDQWSTAHQQYNLQKDEIPGTQLVEAGSDDGQAWVESTAVRSGVRTITRYAFGGDHPRELTVSTTVTRIAAGDALHMFGSLILHPRGSLTPFTIDTRDGEYSRGFDQPAFDTADRSAILGTVSAADLQVVLGSRHIQPSISYGIRMLSARHQDSSGEQEPVQSFMMGGQFFTLFGVFSRPFPTWSRTPGLLSFLASRFMDLETGESLVIRQAILLGEKADAASVTDRIYRGPEIYGQLDSHQAGISVKDDNGGNLTFVRPESDGRFRFRIPEQTQAVDLSIITPWGSSSRRFEVSGRTVDLGKLGTGAAGTVMLPQGEPMNLIFQVPGENPIFGDELTGSRVGGERALTGAESHRVSLSGSEQDLRSVQLAPGRYRVIASRGLEYSVSETTIELEAGDSLNLSIARPAPLLESEGLISADLHVHSGVSFDSSLLPEQRITDFVAQGCEVLVPTEHHITYDLQPVIKAMGLEERVVSFPGVELTGMIRSEQAPTTIGHSNVFPVVVDAQAFMGGTLPFEGRRLGQVIGDYKARFPDGIFQLNHPRLAVHDSDVAFFNHLSLGLAFDPNKEMDDEPNSHLMQVHPGSQYRDIDFDAMELLSGEAMDGYEATRTDWFALLKQGIYKVATANSDSHASHQVVALPRNYLATEVDSPESIAPEDIVRAIRSGHVYGTTGPMIRVRLGEVGPGGVFRGSRATLHLRMDAAPWVDVHEFRVWINGQLWRSLPARSGQELGIEVEVNKDSFVFVEAAGTASEMYEIVAPGFEPFAFANPVFMDVDGNGWFYGE